MIEKLHLCEQPNLNRNRLGRLQYIMMGSKLIVFLFLLLQVLATPLTQQEVEDFIKQSQLVPPTATLKSYYEEQGKSFVIYSDQFSTFKFAISQDQRGKPFVVFRHQMTEVKFENKQSDQLSQIVRVSPSLFIQPFPPIQTIPAPPTQNYDVFTEKAAAHSNYGRRRRSFPQRIGNMPCRINVEEIKNIFKQNILIFKNAEITGVKKIGFQKGSGILLQIDLLNDGKSYKAEASYVPRWKKLAVTKIQEAETQEKSLQTAVSSSSKDINNVLSSSDTPLTRTGTHFETLLQSFIEKLLVRKDRDNQVVQDPKPLTENQEVLFGSQGQLERNLKVPTVESPQQIITEEKQQVQSALKSSTKSQPSQRPEKGEHHLEENSEQISELVTEVISKIKLKTK